MGHVPKYPFLGRDIGSWSVTRRTDLKKKLDIVFLNFEVWVAESKVFDIKFHFSMSKSPWGQVLSRFCSIGDGFIRGRFFKKVFF